MDGTTFCKVFAHRRSFASSRCVSFIFSRAIFRASSQLTECVEEATDIKANHNVDATRENGVRS